MPDGAALGQLSDRVVATSSRATAKAAGTVHVVGDVIEFTPSRPTEEPWLFDAGGSQLDGASTTAARFADNERYFVYRFEIGDDVTGGTLRLLLHGGVPRAGVQRRRRAGRRCWRRRGGSPTARTTTGASSTSTTLADPGETLYLRIADSFPDDGWGGWLGRLRLELQTA